MIFITQWQLDQAKSRLPTNSTIPRIEIVLESKFDPTTVNPDRPWPNPDVPTHSLYFDKVPGGWKCVTEYTIIL